ncbi:uncharacterized protein LOC108112492 [Drosophila eugracilis]|uniref:uncharacterized protein LOC108112492 n=1 Tax=Drosophila eugracilis TaxID=29029 RepID=UPI001BDB0F0A|nr:uncharacterized protein LOC108112492 [Drosophila eugracilis]
MEGALSFIEVDPACLILIVLGISLLDFIVNNCLKPTKDDCNQFSCTATTKNHNECESETPLARHFGLRPLQLRQRVKLLSSVKRRLDEQF